ncbi:MAG: hypothetical protein WC600_17195 [Desulfobaccales bacterium]
MSSTKHAPPIDEVKVLFPEEQVGPYTLRPWTLMQFGQACALLVELLKALAPVGLTFENAEVFLVERWPELLPVALPYFPALIGLTLRMEPDEVAALDAGTQAALGLRILLQNKDQLKNFLTLAVGSLGAGASAGPLN